MLALAAVISACSGTGQAASHATPTKTSPAPPAAAATVSPVAVKAPGPLNLRRSVVAQGLVAPWALDFAADGAIWLTERPGRVRVIRDGKLLAEPALTLPVFNRAGCEGGLLGLAIREPYVYLVYTVAGPSGNANRLSRFTIQGGHLVSEQVLWDAIPGGACYHFGGRLKFGPDGWLYLTNGEGFVAARAADPNSLSGKVLRIHPDGTGGEIYAWGFRNPQGLAWDGQGRLYISNNGPSGEFGLCCHDEVDQVQQGGFYGWPAWAAGTRTSYPQGTLPARSGPIAESGNAVWAPSGIAFYAPSAAEWPTLLVAELRGTELRRMTIDPAQPQVVASQEVILSNAGRLRDVVQGPDHCAYVLTSNRDGRGNPKVEDDTVLSLCPA